MADIPLIQSSRKTVMEVFTPEELEHDILHELKEEIFELYEASLQNLVELKLTPSDNEIQRSLFRSVHTIKGDLGLVAFTPMIEVMQYLEDILDMLRKSEISYSTSLHDLVISLLDKVSCFVDECVSNGKAQYDKQAIDAISSIIKQFTANNTHEHDSLLKQAIAVNNGRMQENANKPSEQLIVIPKTGMLKNISMQKQIDISFFRELMQSIEKRAGMPAGRGDKIAGLALYINALSNTPIEEDQLVVACYTHDFGLAFMPDALLYKEGDLTKTEHDLLLSHVYKSASLLEHMPEWEGAQKIILHHHERQDGSGFPLGITGDKINEGAKLLAIVETYINLTNENKSNMPVLPEVEAIISINKTYKQAFSGRWLRLFNKGMTDYLNQ